MWRSIFLKPKQYTIKREDIWHVCGVGPETEAPVYYSPIILFFVALWNMFWQSTWQWPLFLKLKGDIDYRTWSQTAGIWIRISPFIRGMYPFSYRPLQILSAILSPGLLAATPSQAIAATVIYAWVPNGFRGKQVNSTWVISPAVSPEPPSLFYFCRWMAIKCQGITLTMVLAQPRRKCQKNIWPLGHINPCVILPFSLLWYIDILRYIYYKDSQKMVLRDPELFNLIPSADQLSNATLQWLSPSQSQSLSPNSYFLGLHSLI